MVTINKNRLKKLESKIKDNAHAVTEVEQNFFSELISRFSKEDLYLSVDVGSRALNKFIELKYCRSQCEIDILNTVTKKWALAHENRAVNPRDREDYDRNAKACFPNEKDRALIEKALDINHTLIKKHDNDFLELYKQGKIEAIYELSKALWNDAEAEAIALLGYDFS